MGLTLQRWEQWRLGRREQRDGRNTIGIKSTAQELVHPQKEDKAINTHSETTSMTEEDSTEFADIHRDG